MANTVIVKSALGFAAMLGGISLFPNSYDTTESLPIPERIYACQYTPVQSIDNCPNWCLGVNNIEVIPEEYKILDTFVKSILDESVPLEPEFSKIVDENFWDLI